MAARERPVLPRTLGEAMRGFIHPSPVVLIIALATFLALRLVLGSWSWVDAAIVGGLVVAWPLLEWLIHVFVLHFRPVAVGRRTLDMKVAAIHRDHHADPWYLPDVFIPVHVIWWTGPFIIAIPLLTLPLTWASTFLVTYFALSLHYEWCHYLAHIDWAPKNRYYRRRIARHRWHHFQNEKMWWGVSTGWGDTVIGTGPDRDEAPRTDTTHALLKGMETGRVVRVRRGRLE